ncbi:hypothetical protein [Chishuiella sp.]|uniref:hypothetical protein n=1 Tax=Chishuiella sp. TaxID=1969467 RepID=UPI0028B0B50D|nr:hypothetical protein [Chishuiella sp.]
MKNKFYLILTITTLIFALQSCEHKKQADTKITDSIVYENALDVPVEKLAVSINVDTISFSGNKSKESNIKINNQLLDINKNFNINKDINDTSVKILNDNHYNYEIINNLNKNILPNGLVTKDNLNEIDFNQLKNITSLNDLLLINVKPVISYNEDNKNEYVAKTYLYINIIDLKNKTLKYSETAGGTKYFDKDINKITTDYLQKMIKESLNETINLIDKKY